MPVYPKTGRPNTWRVKVWHEGKWIERLVPGSKRDATSFEARWRTELESGKNSSSQRTAPTLYELCDQSYTPYAANHLKSSTQDVRSYQLATLIQFFGPMRMTAIRPDDVERFKRSRLDAGRKPRTVNNELAVLQAVLTFAKRQGVPCADFKVQKLPTRGRGRVTFWTLEQVSMLFAEVERVSPDLLPLVVFLANTGCRKGEALAAERDWIDLRGGLIRIPVNEHWSPKDNEPREIPISDALRPWLERAMQRPGRWLFPARAYGDEKEPHRYAVWPKFQFDRARKLAGHSEDCFKRINLKRACSCGAKGLRGGPHTLRHTFAAHFLRGKGTMYNLSRILGHSDQRTSEIYAHLLPEHMEEARNVVNMAPGVGAAEAEARRRWAK